MGAKPVHERPVDPPDTHASALDSSRNDRFDRDPQRIAYDLWCLQENRRMAGQTLEPLNELVHALRARNPWLEEADIARGIDVFLTRTVMEVARSFTARHRYFFEVPRLRPRMVAATRGPCSASACPRVSTDCTAMGISGYNGKNDRTPDAGISNDPNE